MLWKQQWVVDADMSGEYHMQIHTGDTVWSSGGVNRTELNRSQPASQPATLFAVSIFLSLLFLLHCCCYKMLSLQNVVVTLCGVFSRLVYDIEKNASNEALFSLFLYHVWIHEKKGLLCDYRGKCFYNNTKFCFETIFLKRRHFSIFIKSVVDFTWWFSRRKYQKYCNIILERLWWLFRLFWIHNNIFLYSKIGKWKLSMHFLTFLTQLSVGREKCLKWGTFHLF